MATCGETHPDCLRFFNGEGNYREIKRVDFTHEGLGWCTLLQGQSLGVLMSSQNGSLIGWGGRQFKVVEMLAPNFIEVEENVEYVERESEFEQEIEDERVSEGDTDIVGVEELTLKQKKLANFQINLIDEDDEEQIQVKVHSDDSFAVLARKQINMLKDKFNGLLPQPGVVGADK